MGGVLIGWWVVASTGLAADGCTSGDSVPVWDRPRGRLQAATRRCWAPSSRMQSGYMALPATVRRRLSAFPHVKGPWVLVALGVLLHPAANGNRLDSPPLSSLLAHPALPSSLRAALIAYCPSKSLARPPRPGSASLPQSPSICPSLHLPRRVLVSQSLPAPSRPRLLPPHARPLPRLT